MVLYLGCDIGATHHSSIHPSIHHLPPSPLPPPSISLMCWHSFSRVPLFPSLSLLFPTLFPYQPNRWFPIRCFFSSLPLAGSRGWLCRPFLLFSLRTFIHSFDKLGINLRAKISQISPRDQPVKLVDTLFFFQNLSGDIYITPLHCRISPNHHKSLQLRCRAKKGND